MADITWYSGLTLVFDPSSVEDIYQDWSGWLEGEVFDPATPPTITATGVTATISDVTGAVVKVRVSVLTDPATFTVRATSASGRVADRTVLLDVTQL